MGPDFLLPTGGRKSRKLIAVGQHAEAIVVGIRIDDRAETAARWEYALDVLAASGTFRAGCRQNLEVDARRGATIGARVPVRHDGEQVIIDETAWLGAEAGTAAVSGNTGWAAVKPPPPGIDDARFAKHQRSLAQGTPTAARVVAVEPTAWEERWNLVVQVGGSDAIDVDGKVPHYAASRVVVGADLPAAMVAGGKVLIDWAAVTGATDPPPTVVRRRPSDGTDVEPETQASPIGHPYAFEDKDDAAEFSAWLKIRVMRSSGVPTAHVDRMMKKAGIAPESWPTVDTKWTQRCATSPNLAEQLRLSGR